MNTKFKNPNSVPTWLIVISFIGVTFQDLIFGGVGSTIVGYRFFVPVIIDIELTIAFLLESKIIEEADCRIRKFKCCQFRRSKF